jgi:CRP-like cAMP-binding protein
MSVPARAQAANRLITGLPRKERQALLDCCDTIDLTFGLVLCEPDEPLSHVYFPLTGYISLLTPVTGRAPLEMGLVGNEGMLGVTLVLGVNAMPMQALVQGPGAALRMSVPDFRRQLRHSPVLLRRLNRHLYLLMAQLAQTAACTRFHDVEQRLARWLLMSHDRAHADQFYLTHRFLADMLGVRRSGVTVAAGDLQRRELISYARGQITVLDRRGLEAASCECYQAAIKDYSQRFT